MKKTFARVVGLVIALGFLVSVGGIVSDIVSAQDSGSSHREILARYGLNSLADRNGDGRVNAVDWTVSQPGSGGPGIQGSVNFLSVDQIEGKVVPGELIVKLKDESQLTVLEQAVEVDQVRRIAMLTMADLNLAVVILKDKSYHQTATAHNLISLSGNYQTVSPNWLATANTTTPNDPIYSDSGQWNLEAVHAPEAWDMVTGTRNDPDIFAAVIDTGVDLDHPDLGGSGGNLYGNFKEWQGGVASGASPPDYYNGVDDDGNGIIDDVYGVAFDPSASLTPANNPSYDVWGCDNLVDPVDSIDLTHGTNMAGVIAAIGNNREGVSGVGWNGRIFSINYVFRDQGICNSSFYSFIASVDFANYIKAPVINYSSGFICLPPDADEADCEKEKFHYENFMKPVIRNFTHDQNGQIKALFVTGPANQKVDYDQLGGYFDYPCTFFDNQANLCVTGTELEFSSNAEILNPWQAYGATTVDLAAPGSEVITTNVVEIDSFPYIPITGTSAATPHVVGAILLMMQTNPDLSMEQVRDIILATVDTKEDVASFGLDYWPDNPEWALEDKVKTGGRLNLARAVACAQDLSCLGECTVPTDNLVENGGFDQDESHWGFGAYANLSNSCWSGTDRPCVDFIPGGSGSIISQEIDIPSTARTLRLSFDAFASETSSFRVGIDGQWQDVNVWPINQKKHIEVEIPVQPGPATLSLNRVDGYWYRYYVDNIELEVADSLCSGPPPPPPGEGGIYLPIIMRNWP